MEKEWKKNAEDMEKPKRGNGFGLTRKGIAKKRQAALMATCPKKTK